jgi:hypothetical protein
MIRLLIILSLILMVVACAPSGEQADPSDTVLQYMQAKIDGDKDALSTLLCAELESTLNREAQSFVTVDAVLEDATCTSDDDVVTCTGAIVADYGGEDTEFPLMSYHVVQEDDVWKWCGEAE